MIDDEATGELTSEGLPTSEADSGPAPRFRVTLHGLDGAIEQGESDSRSFTKDGYPIYVPPGADRPRLIAISTIKYVVFGSVDDPDLELDPGNATTDRKAILHFRDGEWITGYVKGVGDGLGIPINIRLTERQRVIPGVAANGALLNLEFTQQWDAPQPHRRRSDVGDGQRGEAKVDLSKLAGDYRDRLALIRDVGLTAGDSLAFSRAVRMNLDRFLAEDGINLTASEKSSLVDIILRAAVGYGPLDGLLHDRSVSEIMVNGTDQVFIERKGVIVQAEVRFEDENQLLETIRRMVATTGRHIDGLNPMVDARLPDGSRVNAIIRPASIHGPALTIRKFKDAVLGIDDLTREGSLSPAMAEFLQAAVLGRMNILVSGGTGSGKTTTLNVIARFIPHNQRVITIEDAAELQIDHPHIVSLEGRPPNVEGKGELTIRQLLRNSLRMRPDRILVGEVRGAEALDMLQAMNTGHDGSMSTIHSNSARDALSRLETMVMMASIDIPFEAVRAQIASAVNLIVHQARMPDGRRKVAQIAEVVGYDANGAILRDIFVLGMGGDLRLEYNATGYVPTSLDKAAFYGVQVNKDLFDPTKARFVPAGSDSMMPVVKDPLVSTEGRGAAAAQRTVFVVPFSSDRPADVAARQQAAAPQMQMQMPSPATFTPEMQEEMRNLMADMRAATSGLQQQAAPPPLPAAPGAPPPSAHTSAAQAASMVPAGTLAEATQAAAAATQAAAAATQAATAATLAAPTSGAAPAGQGGSIAPVQQQQQPLFVGQAPTSAESAQQASQALQAATALSRAAAQLGQLAGYGGQFSLPTVSVAEGQAGASKRRIQAVIESLVARAALNLRLAPTIANAFEGAEIKAADYATPNKLSIGTASRELRSAADAGLLEAIKYPHGETGYKSGQKLMHALADLLGQQVNPAQPLNAETIIGSLSAGQTEGTVTMMFTDVQGSTDMLSTRGFTESHEIMRAYEEIIREKIKDHSGREMKGLGDGFMVSFGSVRHAVESALDIQKGVAEYARQNPDRGLKIKIGINTGEVVEEAGDLFGAAVNIAARISTKARGGDVLVSELVRQLVGPVQEIKFNYKGAYKLKGFPDRYRIFSAVPGEVLVQTVVPAGDGFVDREQEKLDMRMLMDRAEVGTGALVLVSGAPGMGTSRFADEVAREAIGKGWKVLSGRSPDLDGGPPYATWGDPLRTAGEGLTARQLNAVLGANAPLIAELVPTLRNKLKSKVGVKDVNANQLRERLFTAVHEYLGAYSGDHPLLLILHDLHWADEASVLLLRNLAERVASSKLLVICTFWDTELDSGRPFTRAISRLLKRRRAQRMTLGPLGEKDVANMVRGLAKKEVPELQVIGIQAATEGNPLFVEHSYLHLAESESFLVGGARRQSSYTEEDLELAQSVRGLIGRRLERLSEPANRMLVAAGIVSRDFDLKLLEAFGELSGRELREAIDEAVQGHFLVASGPDRYRFAHELVRQRVMAGLTLPRQQAYHLAIADTLEKMWGTNAEHSAEIGYHLYQAGTAADAVRTAHHLLLATQRAVAVGAFEEVIRLAEATLLLLPANEVRERAQVLVARGEALWGLGRLVDARAAWDGAIQRYEELGDAKTAKAMRERQEKLNPPAAAASTPAPDAVVEPDAPPTPDLVVDSKPEVSKPPTE